MLKFMFVFTSVFLLSLSNVNAEIKIGAILAKSGPASFLGLPEAKTLTMIEEIINAQGGIKIGEKQEKIKLIIKDSRADAQLALGFAKQLIEEEDVLAIIGPSTSGESIKLKSYCEEKKKIMISCAAAEEIVNPIAKYVFKTPQKDSDAAKRIFEVMKKKGIKKIGVLSSNTAFGSTGKAQLEKIASAYKIEIVINEVYDKAITDLSEILSKIKATEAQAIVNWSIEPAQGIIPKNMKKMGYNIPLFQSHGFGNIKYVKMAGDEAAEGIIFPAGRLLVCSSLPDNNKQKSILLKYKTDFEKRFKEDVSSFGGHAYDALTILIKAIEKAGSADSEKVRDAIENTKGFVGTGGTFNFSAADHTGLDKNAFEILTVKKGNFEIYK